MPLKQTYEQEEIHSRWESVYRDHPVLKRFNDCVMDRVLVSLNPQKNALFLDAGCGVGDHSFRIVERGYRCVAVDLSENMIAIAKKNAVARGLSSRIHFTCQALEDLGFPDAVFDAVHCRGVLMHVPGWQRALASLCRVLKPGGSIAILEGNDKSLELGLVLLVRTIQRRSSRMVRTEGGFEFWSEVNGQPFVVRVANVQCLSDELGRNEARVLTRFAHEFWDINRFPAGLIRNAVIQFNYLYFLLHLPLLGSVGIVIIAQKRPRASVDKRLEP